MALVEGLHGQVARHQLRIAELKAANEELHKELAEAKRAESFRLRHSPRAGAAARPSDSDRKLGIGAVHLPQVSPVCR